MANLIKGAKRTSTILVDETGDILIENGQIPVNIKSGNISIDEVGIKDTSETRIDPATLQKQTDIETAVNNVKTSVDNLRTLYYESAEVQHAEDCHEFTFSMYETSIADGDAVMFMIDTSSLSSTKKCIVKEIIVSADAELRANMFINPTGPQSSALVYTAGSTACTASPETDVRKVTTVASWGTGSHKVYLPGGTSSSGFGSDTWGTRNMLTPITDVRSGYIILYQFNNISGYTLNYFSAKIKVREEDI